MRAVAHPRFLWKREACLDLTKPDRGSDRGKGGRRQANKETRGQRRNRPRALRKLDEAQYRCVVPAPCPPIPLSPCLLILCYTTLTASFCDGLIVSSRSRRVIFSSSCRRGPIPHRTSLLLLRAVSFLFMVRMMPMACEERYCTFSKSSTIRRRSSASTRR